jgi:hypothetical protein
MTDALFRSLIDPLGDPLWPRTLQTLCRWSSRSHREKAETALNEYIGANFSLNSTRFVCGVLTTLTLLRYTVVTRMISHHIKVSLFKWSFIHYSAPH